MRADVPAFDPPYSPTALRALLAREEVAAVDVAAAIASARAPSPTASWVDTAALARARNALLAACPGCESLDEARAAIRALPLE